MLIFARSSFKSRIEIFQPKTCFVEPSGLPEVAIVNAAMSDAVTVGNSSALATDGSAAAILNSGTPVASMQDAEPTEQHRCSTTLTRAI
jgi:hypothetical protein